MFIAYALQLCHLINYIFLQEKISMELCILMNALNYIYIYIHTHTYTCICCCLVTKLCLTLLQLHGLNSPSGSSVHGIFQARILEWFAISFSKGSSQPRDQIHVFRWILYHWVSREAHIYILPSKEGELTTKWKWTRYQWWVIKKQVYASLYISTCRYGEMCVFEVYLKDGESVYNRTVHF